MASLSVDNLKVVYRGVILALQGVSLRAGPGEAIGILGPNGAGKSTLVRALSGLLPQYDGRVVEGTISVGGRDTAHAPALAVAGHGLTAVLEGRPVFRYLSALENLRAAGHKLSLPRLKQGMEEVFLRFPRIFERRHEQAGYLSGGEQQMLLLGMALLTEPEVLVVDEPSLGLAPKLVDEVMKILGELRRDKGLTLLLVEQNAHAAFTVVDRVYVLEQGKVVFEGSSESAKADTGVMEFYLGAGAGGFAEAKRYRRGKRWF